MKYLFREEPKQIKIDRNKLTEVYYQSELGTKTLQRNLTDNHWRAFEYIMQ